MRPTRHLPGSTLPESTGLAHPALRGRVALSGWACSEGRKSRRPGEPGE